MWNVSIFFGKSQLHTRIIVCEYNINIYIITSIIIFI
jgi:hypothetical protein